MSTPHKIMKLSIISVIPIFSLCGSIFGNEIRDIEKEWAKTMGKDDDRPSMLRGGGRSGTVPADKVLTIYKAVTEQMAAADNSLKNRNNAAMAAMLYVSYTSGTWVPSKYDVYSIMQKIMKQDMSATLSTNLFDDGMDMDRSITCAQGGCIIPLSWSDLNGYGCWCNFNDQITQGNGPPVDVWDEICKEVQLCTKCTVIDSNDTCDLPNTVYDFNPFMDFNTFRLDADCDGTNAGDECAIGLCKCQLQMYNKLHELIIRSNPPKEVLQFKHEFGFDRQDANNCPKLSHATQKQLECCGVAPSRFPYNDFLHDCCPNGEIVPFGGC